MDRGPGTGSVPGPRRLRSPWIQGVRGLHLAVGAVLEHVPDIGGGLQIALLVEADLADHRIPVMRTQRLRHLRGVGGAGLARSEEHTSELQSLMRISYAVFCLKKKHKTDNRDINMKFKNQAQIKT